MLLAIQDDIPLHEHTLPRAEAEAKYKKDPVNHTFIYDAYPVPPELQTLRIVEIPKVNVNCCQGPHLKSTGGLQALFVQKVNADGKNKYKFSFAIGKGGSLWAHSSV